jgi:hypothetical protein
MKKGNCYVLYEDGDMATMKVVDGSITDETRFIPGKGIWKVLKNKNPYIFIDGAWVKKSSLPKVPKVFKCDMVSYIRMRLQINDQWALRALVRLYELQTKSEKNRRVTVESNGQGFDAMDAPLFTTYVMQLHRRISLTKEQMDLLHKRIHRYAEQIFKLSNKEELVASMKKYYSTKAPVDGVIPNTQ